MKRLLLAIAIALTATSAEAQTWVKQSTARDVLIGPFVDETDGKTPETGLASSSISLHKGIGSPSTITLGSHIGGGMYSVSLTTGNTDTLGESTIVAEVSGALPVWKTLLVLPDNTYDSLAGGTDYIETNVKQVDDTAASTALASAADIAQAVWEYVIGTEPTAVPPTAGTTEVLDMLKYVYYYGGGFNKVNSDLTNGEGEMQYYDSGGTKRFERDVTKAGTVTTKDEVRAND